MNSSADSLPLRRLPWSPVEAMSGPADAPPDPDAATHDDQVTAAVYSFRDRPV
jgi:hypothetical protein